MTRIRLSLLALAGGLALPMLVAATPSLAEKWDGGCQTQATATTATSQIQGSRTISDRNSIACFTFVETDLATENSPVFQVTAEAAQVCFDSDIAATGAGAATVDIRVCPHGVRPAANPDQQCHPATAVTEAVCLAINPGVYYFDITAVPAGGSNDTARVVVRGLGSN